jgi:hypothetical protein
MYLQETRRPCRGSAFLEVAVQGFIEKFMFLVVEKRAQDFACETENFVPARAGTVSSRPVSQWFRSKSGRIYRCPFPVWRVFGTREGEFSAEQSVDGEVTLLQEENHP